MKCLLDLDGVIADFVNSSCKYHKIDNPYYKSLEARGTWDFVGELLEMSSEEFFAPLGYEFWRDLEWMHDGREILELVEGFFQPKNVCILTSPCHTEGCVDGKRAWIQKHIPQYKDRVLFGACKEFCANSRHILIDDREENTVKFAQAGGTGLLVPRVWNSKHELSKNAVAHVAAALEFWVEKTI